MDRDDVFAKVDNPNSTKKTTPSTSTDPTTTSTQTEQPSTSTSEKEKTDNQVESTTTPSQKAGKKASKKKNNQGSELETKDKQQWPTPVEAKERPKKGGKGAQNSSPTVATTSTAPLPPVSSSQGSPQPTNSKNRQKKGVNWVPLKDALGPQPVEEEGGRSGGSRPSSTASPSPNSNPPLSPTSTTPPHTSSSSTSTGTNPSRGRGSNRGSRPSNRGGAPSRSSNAQRGTGSSSATSPKKSTQAPPLKESVQKQIEYYFSTDNLCKDIYLRKHMDDEGWVSLDLLANFNCVQKLTQDKQLILDSLQSSTILELENDKLRLKGKWNQWLFPPNVDEQGKEEASEADRVEKDDDELVEFDETLLGSYDGSDYEEDEVKDLDDHHISNLLIITRNPDENLPATSSNQDIPADLLSFLNDGLLVYEHNLQNKPLSPLSSSPSASTALPLSPTSSRPSLAVTPPPTTPPTKGKKKSGQKKGKGDKKAPPASPLRLYPKDKNAAPEVSPPVGWVMNSPKPGSSQSAPIAIPLSSSPGGSSQVSSSPEKADPKKVPYFPHPSHALLEENGFVQHQYDKYHDQCLKERKQKGIGKSQEMNTLFRFWSHFLRTHYNERMYNEMKQFALEDADANYRYGMECLFRYFSYGLEKRFRNNLFTDFQDLTLRDYRNGQLYGLEKFWAYLKYRKDKRPLTINPELAKLLGNYNRLEDFRPKI
jgi:la-related protein 1